MSGSQQSAYNPGKPCSIQKHTRPRTRTNPSPPQIPEDVSFWGRALTFELSDSAVVAVSISQTAADYCNGKDASTRLN